MPEMIRRGLIALDVLTSGFGSVEAWQKTMSQVGNEVDHLFIITASEMLGRQIILYPVIPQDGQEDRVIISPSTQNNHESYHILLYDEAVFITPHYQSLRPRQQIVVNSQPAPKNPNTNTPKSSILSKLNSFVGQSSNSASAINSLSENATRISLDSVPDDSNLMPPPNHHSSINKKKKQRTAEKCKEAEPLTKKATKKTKM